VFRVSTSIIIVDSGFVVIDVVGVGIGAFVAPIRRELCQLVGIDLVMLRIKVILRLPFDHKGYAQMIMEDSLIFPHSSIAKRVYAF